MGHSIQRMEPTETAAHIHTSADPLIKQISDVLNYISGLIPNEVDGCLCQRPHQFQVSSISCPLGRGQIHRHQPHQSSF